MFVTRIFADDVASFFFIIALISLLIPSSLLQAVVDTEEKVRDKEEPVAATTTTITTTAHDLIPRILLANFQTVCDVLKKEPSEATTTKGELFFQCLPYVTGNSKGRDIFFPQAAILLTLEAPPVVDVVGDGKTRIRVNRLTMPVFHVLSESDFRPDIELELQISWFDSRLRWDPEEWHIYKYPVDLKPGVNFWGPKFSSKPNSRVDALFDMMSYQESVLSYTGQVNATLSGQLVFSDCKMDVSKFPYDYISCCMDFALSPADNKAKLDVPLSDSPDSTEVIWDMEQSGIWKVQNVDFKPAKLGKTGMLEGSRLCVTARRNTAALGAELSMPMGVSAIVMILSQFAGKWHMQIYVKMFALFLQLFCFENLAPNEALNIATTVPRVYVFYNFTIIMTLLSLVQTMICWALSRRYYSAPPPHKLTSLMNYAGRILLGDTKETRAETSLNVIENANSNGNVTNNMPSGGVTKPGDFSAQWSSLLSALHAVLSIFILLIYLLGVVIIIL